VHRRPLKLGEKFSKVRRRLLKLGVFIPFGPRRLLGDDGFKTFGPRCPLVLAVLKTFGRRVVLRDAQAEGDRYLLGVTISAYYLLYSHWRGNNPHCNL